VSFQDHTMKHIRCALYHIFKVQYYSAVTRFALSSEISDLNHCLAVDCPRNMFMVFKVPYINNGKMF
jgi:hypothetical protein